MTKKVAVVQSNYIPWKGYFDLINRVDEFILFDDVQYTRRDWRNRNKIKTAHGTAWLSIPVDTKGKYDHLIKDITISEPGWNMKHWKSIVAHYSKARCFKHYERLLKDLYLSASDTHLSAVNHKFLSAICGILGIRTKLSWSMDYTPPAAERDRTVRLVELCHKAGATSYLSGPSARAYIDAGAFERAGIELAFIDYSGYPEHTQLYPPFDHQVTVLDLILNEGPDAPRYMLSFPR